jgi:hypothetical protein
MGTSIVLSISLPPSPFFCCREYRGDGEGGDSNWVGEEHCSEPFRTTEERRRKQFVFVGKWDESEGLLCSRTGEKSEYSSDGNSSRARWGENGGKG